MRVRVRGRGRGRGRGRVRLRGSVDVTMEHVEYTWLAADCPATAS